MRKKEITTLLDKALFKRITVEDPTQFETYYVYKSSIIVNLTNDIAICLELNTKHKEEFFNFSAICANGNELQLSLDSAIEVLKKYINLEITLDQISNSVL